MGGSGSSPPPWEGRSQPSLSAGTVRRRTRILRVSGNQRELGKEPGVKVHPPRQDLDLDEVSDPVLVWIASLAPPSRAPLPRPALQCLAPFPDEVDIRDPISSLITDPPLKFSYVALPSIAKVTPWAFHAPYGLPTIAVLMRHREPTENRGQRNRGARAARMSLRSDTSRCAISRNLASTPSLRPMVSAACRTMSRTT